MATINKGKESAMLENHESIIDDTLGKSEDFVKRNKTIISIVLGVILLATAGYFFYKYYIGERDKEAQSEMFGAVYYFEADSLQKALKGDGKDLGFIDISEDYAGTKAGNLSNFYIGIIYLKQGKFEDAITYLKDFSSDDLLLQARAYALVGDAKLELKDVEGSIEFYNKAAQYYPNEFFTPKYLIKLGLAHELNKDYESALKDYDAIINNYFKSAEANEAKKLKAAVEEKISK